MALTKEQKTKQIEKIKENLLKQRSVILIDFSKIPAKDMFSLRDNLKKEGCDLKVVKKTLAKIAFEQAKLPFGEKIKSCVQGQLALIFGFDDELKPLQIANSFAKQHENFKIMGGIFPGALPFSYEFLEREKALALANLPSKRELLSKLMDSIVSPLTSFMNVLTFNIKGLLFLINNIKEEKEKLKNS